MQLNHLGIIAVRGVDARRFLNGQLSQDVLALRPDRVELAGLHNPQGRLLAVMHLVAHGDADVLLILRRELLGATLASLSRYVLRAKLKLSDETDAWQLNGYLPTDTLLSAPAARLPAEAGAALETAAGMIWRYAADGRIIELTSAAADRAAPPPGDSSQHDRWHAADIAAGLPVVYAATAGEFVAQMLNLDALGGISFTKGCYTGQEVIARAHYRGRVKRRLQRFSINDLLPSESTASSTSVDDWLIGAQVKLADGRSAQLVDVGPREISPRECLAVTTFDLPSLPLGYPLPE
jgi:folate-binding protein YgfZ